MFGWFKPKKNYVIESIEEMIKYNYRNNDFIEGYISACFTLGAIKKNEWIKLLGIIEHNKGINH